MQKIVINQLRYGEMENLGENFIFDDLANFIF